MGHFTTGGGEALVAVFGAVATYTGRIKYVEID